MAYIAPNSQITLFKGVPLDNTYNNTLYFSSVALQYTFFTSHYTFITRTAQSYQRVNKNTLRINVATSGVYDYNYIAFKNTSFENKWFYAFITNCEYLNNETVEITYDIDVMQTWFFNCSLGKCFIERQHTTTDGLFEHIADENIEIGDELYRATTSNIVDFNSNRTYIVVATKCWEVGNTTEVSFSSSYVRDNNDNIIYPIPLYVDFTTTIGGLSYIVSHRYAGHSDDIVQILSVPSEMIRITRNEISTGQGDVCIRPITEDIDTYFSFTNIDGYTPKNKKLYCYPYNRLLLTNYMGEKVELQFEHFNSSRYEVPVFTFNVRKLAFPNPVVQVIPKTYNNYTASPDNSISLKTFPEVAWIKNSYRDYITQNRNSIASERIGNILNIMSSATTAGLAYAGLGAINPSLAIGAGVTGINNITDNALSAMNTESKIQDAKSAPNGANGTMSADLLNQCFSDYGISVSNLQIHREYAERVDNYFTMFGYAIKKIDTPNVNARPFYTFVKTVGCNLKGNAPSSAISDIKKIFDSGITFWSTVGGATGDVGNYSLDNTV